MVPKTPDIQIDLGSLNHTELVLLTKWCGLPASRGWPREILTESLQKFAPETLSIPFDIHREKINDWMARWWERLQMQVDKKVCPDCTLCGDSQVLNCYLDNKTLIEG